MFSLIWAWIKDWVNNREAGDLRRHRAHYDVTVMWVGGPASRYYLNRSSFNINWHPGTNFGELWIKLQNVSFNKITFHAHLHSTKCIQWDFSHIWIKISNFLFNKTNLNVVCYIEAILSQPLWCPLLMGCFVPHRALQQLSLLICYIPWISKNPKLRILWFLLSLSVQRNHNIWYDRAMWGNEWRL